MKKQSITERIRQLAEEILRASHKSLGYTDICREIQERDRNLKWNTIRGVTWNWLKERDDLEEPSEGKYRVPTDETNSDAGTSLASVQPVFKKKINEAMFYEPFAEWLEKDVKKATKAIPLGGNKFGGKWNTPDVIGKRKSKPSDIIQQPEEIVSAEIKANSNKLIEAFGQAVSYCLFSHRSYLVIPEQATEDDLSRLESLCQAFGLGLVLFDSTNPKYPDFKIRKPARRQEPNYFFINQNMKKIEDELFT